MNLASVSILKMTFHLHIFKYFGLFLAFGWSKVCTNLWMIKLHIPTLRWSKGALPTLDSHKGLKVLFYLLMVYGQNWEHISDHPKVRIYLWHAKVGKYLWLLVSFSIHNNNILFIASINLIKWHNIPLHDTCLYFLYFKESLLFFKNKTVIAQLNSTNSEQRINS